MNLIMTLPLPPSVNALYQNQAFFNPKTKSYQATGARILTKEGRHMKSRISATARMAVQSQGWDIEKADGLYYLDTTIYFNRRGRDADNIYKALQDSIQGVVFHNDSQILSRTQRIVYDPKNPRIEVKIFPVDFIGIFESKQAFLDFEYICGTCSKYRKGSCSILKDSIAGTVREEIGSIHNPICTEFKQRK